MKRIREKLATRRDESKPESATETEVKPVEGSTGVFVTFGGFVHKDGTDAHV